MVELEATHRAANQLPDELRRLGATVPSKLLAAKRTARAELDRLEATSTAARRLPELLQADNPEVSDVVPVLLGVAIRADPTAVGRVRRHAADGVVSAARGCADEITSGLREVFDKAVSDMANAAKDLGDVSLTDLESVLAAGGRSAAAWQNAVAANEQITRVRTVLATCRRARVLPSPGSRDRRETALEVCDPSYEQYKHVGGAESAWDLYRICGGLSLATGEEHAARVQAMNDAWAKDPRNPVNRGVAGHGIGQIPVSLDTPQIVTIGGQ